MSGEKKRETAIEPKREENYAEWYQQAIRAAELAEHSPVRGCMVIRPWGYAIWENIQRVMDQQFKETGHENAYFPLFIPLSFLEKEAAHVEGFAKECAVVTHYRLEKNEEGKLIPAGELEEPLVVRPTSEMLIGALFARWITSYRDLPLLINQWANVVRWEMRTRLFLRTAEFLWQEGHTAHATALEAREEATRMLHLYHDTLHRYLALPVIMGEKSASERFPGAVDTYTIEAMMQDRKALQCGTSHFLGQNFAKAAEIKFRDKEEGEQYVWMTSWGITTRLIGAMIMVHGDDDGIVLPPRVASSHIAIIPILHKEESRQSVLSYCHALASQLRQIAYYGRALDVKVDEREMRGGEKSWSWVKKGVPLRLEIGPRDIEADALMLFRRDRGAKEGSRVAREALLSSVTALLDAIHEAIYAKAVAFRDAHIVPIDSREEFYAFFTPENPDQPEIHGGFAYSHWSGEAAVEEIVKRDLNVTIRCIPLDSPEEEGHCVISGRPSRRRVLFAKSY